MKYEIVPLANVSEDPAIETLCKNLAAKKVDQVVAQAAAWNIANKMPWEKLSKLNRRESRYLGNERMFTEKQLSSAQFFVGYVRAQFTPPSETDKYPQIAGEQSDSRYAGNGYSASTWSFINNK